MAFVQKTAASSNGPTSVTPSLTGVVSGNTLCFLLTGSGAPDVVPTDSAGQTWTKAFYYANGTATVAAYYLLSANSGTHTLTWSAGSAADIAYTFVEVPSCSAVDVVGTLGSANDTVTTISTPSITTTNATDILLAVVACDTWVGSSPENVTDPVSGFTTLFVQQNANSFVGTSHIYKEITSTGSQSATWTFNADSTGSRYAAAMLSLKQGASGAVLAGGGTSKTTGSATLTVTSKFAGAGVATSTGRAVLGIPSLAASASSQSTGSATLTVRSVFAGSGTAVTSGSASFASAAPTVTLKQYWLKPWQTTVPAALQTGSNPCTVTAGSMLVAVWAGWDAGQILPPVDGSGTFTVPTNGSQFNGGNITTAIAYQANASGGSHSITPQTITTGVGGQNGEVGLWIYEVTGMPTTAVVRNCAGTHVVSSSQSWSQSSDSSPQVGDIAFAVTTYENSAQQVSAGLTDPPTGWTSIGVNQDASFFIPTEIATKIVSTGGTQTASWSNTDAGTTEHLSVMLTMVPAGGGTAVAFVGAGASDSFGSAALTVRAALAGSAASASVGAASLTVAARITAAASSSAVGAASLVTRAVLAGVGSTQTAGSAALTIGGALAGSGSSSSSGSATLTTSVAISGAGSVATKGQAALTVAAALSGAGVAQTSGSAALTMGGALSGAGSSTTQGSASLTTLVALAGSSSSRSVGGASLTLGGAGAALAGAGTAATQGAASLTTAVSLSGAGFAASAGSATLTTSTGGAALAGGAASTSSGAATLTTRAALAGGGFAISTAAGVLTIGGAGVSFAAAASSTSSGSASLTCRAAFSGSGVARTTGSAALALASPFIPGNEAVWLVESLHRNTQVDAAPRNTRVPALHRFGLAKTRVDS